MRRENKIDLLYVTVLKRSGLPLIVTVYKSLESNKLSNLQSSSKDFLVGSQRLLKCGRGDIQSVAIGEEYNVRFP